MLKKIISGCQTTVERSALDWAIENHVAHGGWCPKGRGSEEGRIPKKYMLQETQSSGFHPQSLRNVIDSDGTVAITSMRIVSRDRLIAKRLTENHGKPWIHIHAGMPNAGERLRKFIDDRSVTILNVVGVEEPDSAKIDEFVRAVLEGIYEYSVAL